MKYVLTSAGNIPVDRKAQDKRLLFRGTFRALAEGKAVALFPEGTSYTEPHIMQVKDGAAWAALEYIKWAQENPDKVKKGAENVMIVPATIVYTNKSKYRSQVIMEFGQPIGMEDYLGQFMSGEEGAPRAAVKRLTAVIERELTQSTINAPDWDTVYAARMARDFLWPDERSINLDDFVTISQTLVDLFSTPDLVPNMNAIKRLLLTYYSLLESTHLTNSVLSSLPLPATLDPRQPVPLPSRLLTLMLHAPAYAMGVFGARLAEDEEETQAQNKVVFGLLLLFMIYPAAFFFVWAFLWYTPVGALVAGSFVFLFAMYHNRLINHSYDRAKRLVAAWRVLVGVWAPKRWDLSLSAVAQYTVPRVPPENPWIDRNKVKVKSRAATPSPSPSPTAPSASTSTSNSTSASTLANATAGPSSGTGSGAGPASGMRRRPPSRRLIRHVLRARVEAAKALASLFTQLERSPEGKRVCAAMHLARAFGGGVDTRGPALEPESPDAVPEPQGWRHAREVVAFLRARGARFRSLEAPVEGDWAALSSDGDESEGVSTSEKDGIVWVPSSQQ
uniref:N/A n=1 Tax=Ganoderma boninense TaxID=34458 RepID=A0A5K1K7U2_9APHY|nr:N/A [Ganoderma boninense]